MISFTVPAVPVAQPRHRIGVINGKGRAFQASKTHPIHAFKASVRQAFTSKHSGPPIEGPIALEAVFVLPRPKAMCWKSREMPRAPHTKRGDLDNLLKGVKDALNELAWRDDGQVCEVVATKFIASGDEQPHVEIEIREITS